MCCQKNDKVSIQGNQGEKEKFGHTLNLMAAWILLVCVVVSLFSVGIFSYGKAINNTTNEVKISYVFQTDSIGKITPASKALADSVLWEVKKHEQRIADKYEYIIEQRLNIENYLTWGGIILTIVFSIFGFFGYKSLHDIQEKIVKLVEPSAQKVAEERADAICKSKYEAYETKTDSQIEALKTLVKADIEKFKGNTESSLRSDMVEMIGKKQANQIRNQSALIETKIYDLYNKIIVQKLQDIDKNTVVIEDIQKEITLMKNSIDENKEVESKKNGCDKIEKGHDHMKSEDPNPFSNNIQ